MMLTPDSDYCKVHNLEKSVLLLISEHVSVEGKVIQRAECRPIPDKKYLDLKR